MTPPPGTPPVPLTALPAPPPPQTIVVPPARRLNGPEATLITVIFTFAVVLKLTGMDLVAELELLGATGTIAAFVVSAATGRIPTRSWIKKLGKLAEDE